MPDSNQADEPMGDQSNSSVKASSEGRDSASAELEKQRNDYLYLRAEFENYKKQMLKERSDLRKYGSERLLAELLSVLDIFETALETPPIPENAATFRKGIELTASALKTTLQKFGVEEIAAHGAPFDPALHEALSSEETDSAPEGHITKVFKKPYKLHDRVIRPAQVVVARAPKPNA